MGLWHERTVLTACEGLGECDTGVQQNFESLQEEVLVTVFDFSISEGSLDIQCGGGHGKVGSCATVAL